MHGPTWARAGTEIVTLAGLASFIAAFWFDGVAVALMALVLLGLAVARVAALPAVLQILTGLTLIGAAWASLLDWYDTYAWLDLVVHVAANGVLAVLVMMVLWRTGRLPRGIASSTIIIVTTALGALLAVIWEMGEWLGHTYLEQSIGVGYDDTISDMAAGVAGSLIAGILLARRQGGSQ